MVPTCCYTYSCIKDNLSIYIWGQFISGEEFTLHLTSIYYSNLSGKDDSYNYVIHMHLIATLQSKSSKIIHAILSQWPCNGTCNALINIVHQNQCITYFYLKVYMFTLGTKDWSLNFYL